MIVRNMYIILLFYLSWTVLIKTELSILPGGYVKCNISDSNFDKCANSSLGKLVSTGVKGIPSLNIKPLEPIFVEHVLFKSTQNSPVSMQLELRNLTFYGFGGLSIISVKGTDLRKNVIQMEGLIMEAKVVANYTMNGKILSLPLQGTGSTTVLLYKMKLAYKSFHKRVSKQGKTYLAVRNITLDASVAGGKVMYKSNEKTNILGLSDEDINDALNENFMVMYHEYAPDINKLLLSEISPRVVKFNNEIPVDELFIE